MSISKADISHLQTISNQLRRNIITMIYKAQSGHPGGSLSASDIMTVLYFHELNLFPDNPSAQDRDRFILSKGHCCPVLYACLAMRGFFPIEILDTLRDFGSILQGHPDMRKVPGLDMTTGSLGQGLSDGVGMALGLQYDKNPARVFVLLGDGETDEGQVWEAAATAAKYKLKNLIAIIDANGLQNDGCCDTVMPKMNHGDKWRAFGWCVMEADGHNIPSILSALEDIRHNQEAKPTCLIAKTIKGKYISFMENVPEWHGKAPNEEQYHLAMEELA